ncbi:hypothetical protein [Pontibacillus litoralis]|uniref:Uncharacterized protein n=1 Tax=Pontibacillus litoralis JSM 072002 TaxID=1385512 RepID=A0A0A5G1R8_9BACI|nr:hypothetical protein [Pontibacillus litoralis]KGX87026.1 hypothetical protein N784_02595 [Pontibacillus litoralis JSM 072002]
MVMLFGFTVFSFSFAHVLLLGYVQKHRGVMTVMQGMMVAMTVGMIGGIFVGTWVALNLDDLFLATFISMGLAIVLGVITGIPIHLFAVMDGVVSGAMGGMMGAMLGVMIMPEHGNVTLQLLLLLLVSSYSLVIYALDQALGIHRKLLHHPVFLVIIYCLYFIIGFII